MTFGGIIIYTLFWFLQESLLPVHSQCCRKCIHRLITRCPFGLTCHHNLNSPTLGTLWFSDHVLFIPPVFISKVFGHKNESQLCSSPFISSPISLAHSFSILQVTHHLYPIFFSYSSWISLNSLWSRNYYYFIPVAVLLSATWIFSSHLAVRSMPWPTLLIPQCVLCMTFALNMILPFLTNAKLIFPISFLLADTSSSSSSSSFWLASHSFH